MNEEQKIEKVLEQYKNYFDTTTADVTTSIKGKRFFYLTDVVSGDIYKLEEFSTAEELERIILQDLISRTHMAISNLNEEIQEELKNHSDLEFLLNVLPIMKDNFEIIRNSMIGIFSYIDNSTEE